MSLDNPFYENSSRSAAFAALHHYQSFYGTYRSGNEINSLRAVTDPMRMYMTVLLGQHKPHHEAKALMEAKFNVQFDSSVFHNLYFAEKQLNAAFDGKNDFKLLFAWLYREQAVDGASADIWLSNHDICGSFYMSRNMKHNLLRW